MKVQAFYRRGSSNNEYAIATSEYPDSALNACLYATTFSSYGLAVTDSTTIQPIADGAVETSFGGDTSQFGSDKVVLTLWQLLSAGSMKACTTRQV